MNKLEPTIKLRPGHYWAYVWDDGMENKCMPTIVVGYLNGEFSPYITVNHGDFINYRDNKMYEVDVWQYAEKTEPPKGDDMEPIDLLDRYLKKDEEIERIIKCTSSYVYSRGGVYDIIYLKKYNYKWSNSKHGPWSADFTKDVE